MPDRVPVVSVLMANRDGAAFIEAALRSVLAQTLEDLEVIVADDASEDDSVERVRRLAERDPRVRLLTADAARGPAAARNRALRAARGRWIAVVDSDDLIHPDRFRRLIGAAERDRADLAADDLLLFSDTDPGPPRLFFRGPLARAPRWIDAAAYVRANRFFGRAPALGYLKPVIRADALRRTGVLYDERLLLTEDFDLVARLLFRGLKLRTYPDPTYFYRRRPGSLSHRLTESQMRASMAADVDLRRAAPDAAVLHEVDRRRSSVKDALVFSEIVDALKAGRWGRALSRAAARPRAAALLRLPLAARLGQLVRPRRPTVDAAVDRPREAVVISRQRVVGETNGSSAYLLSMARALVRAGWRVRFVGPSPIAFGRWPVMRLKPEVGVFHDYVVRGGWKIGRLLVARDPRVALRAMLTGLEAMLARAGLKPVGWVKPAPYAVAAPTAREDALFVARAVRGRAGAVLADYAFLAPLIPYALADGAPNAVIMHDLFSGRGRAFARLGAVDSVARLTAEEEFGLLDQADAVVAIQPDEAEAVRRRARRAQVVVAPMAVEPVPAPQPGEGARLLFVGSNTAPNVIGLRWLFAEAWPLIRAARPDAVLEVAGSVARGLREAPPAGVRVLGLVGDLEPLYARAAVVVSPLTVGSGLKIKLIEALGRGKAVVATPVTVQGVEALVAGAVAVEAEPQAFARAVVDLLADPALRQRLGAAALDCARRRFSPEACWREMLELLEGGPVERSFDGSACIDVEEGGTIRAGTRAS